MFTDEFYRDAIAYDLASIILAEKKKNATIVVDDAASLPDKPTLDFLHRDIERDRRLRSPNLIPNQLYLRVDGIISALSDTLFLKVDGDGGGLGTDIEMTASGDTTLGEKGTALCTTLPDGSSYPPTTPSTHPITLATKSFRGECSTILGDPSAATTAEFWNHAAEQTLCKLKNKGLRFSITDYVATQDMAKVVCGCECTSTVDRTIPPSDVPGGNFALAPPSSSPAPPTCGGVLEVFVDRDVSHPVKGIVGLRTQISIRHPSQKVS